MQQRTLGGEGLLVSAEGLGCMGMSAFYGAHDDEESTATLRRALDLGVTFFDTADVYGPWTNERLVGKALADRRDDVVIATKFGNELDEDGTRTGRVNGTPEYVRRAVDGSLSRLGIEVIDLYYQHRVDPAMPVEETFGALGELVQAGKVRYLGISEASAETHPPGARDRAAHRRADRVLAVHARRRGRRRARHRARARHRVRAVLAARARVPVRAGSARSTTSPRTTSAARARGSRARTSRRTSSSLDRVVAIATRRA